MDLSWELAVHVSDDAAGTATEEFIYAPSAVDLLRRLEQVRCRYPGAAFQFRGPAATPDRQRHEVNALVEEAGVPVELAFDL